MEAKQADKVEVNKNSGATWLTIAMVMLATGCGRNFSGTYSGTETAQGGMVSQASAVQIQLNQDGDNVIGSWSGSGVQGQFIGHAAGDRIDNITLTLGMTPQTPPQGQQPPQQQQPACAGTFTGTLMATGNQLSGSLSMSQSQGGMYQGYGCGNSKFITATK